MDQISTMELKVSRGILIMRVFVCGSLINILLNSQLFLGMMPKYKDLYTYLQKCGYTLVFKEVIYDHDGKAKGNCDADIVVQAMRDAYENKFGGAVLVSSDGDYAPLVKFLIEMNKMDTVLSPYETKKCSVLLKRTGVKIAYISDQQTVLQKEKAPNVDGTTSGSSS
jgi:uncharacterized LabA/DUF88 family protein